MAETQNSAGITCPPARQHKRQRSPSAQPVLQAPLIRPGRHLRASDRHQSVARSWPRGIRAAGTPAGTTCGEEAGADILVAVGDPSELADRHGLLLDVVLREEAGLPRHHLLDGRWDDELVDVIVAPTRLPLLGRNYLLEAKRAR